MLFTNSSMTPISMTMSHKSPLHKSPLQWPYQPPFATWLTEPTRMRINLMRTTLDRIGDGRALGHRRDQPLPFPKTHRRRSRVISSPSLRVSRWQRGRIRASLRMIKKVRRWISEMPHFLRGRKQARREGGTLRRRRRRAAFLGWARSRRKRGIP